MITEEKPKTISFSKELDDFKLPTYALKFPTNDKEYQLLESLLDKLIDLVRDNEDHALADVMEIIGNHLEAYDNQHNQSIEDDVTPVELISYLMKVNDLKQKDLVGIFGSQGNVSSFLNGRRKLTLTQIKGLKELFNISADCLIA